MSETKQGKPARNLLILSLAGTMLAALGLAEAFAGTGLMPAQWRFEHYDFIMIGVGYALTVPYTMALIKAAQKA